MHSTVFTPLRLLRFWQKLQDVSDFVPFDDASCLVVLGWEVILLVALLVVFGSVALIEMNYKLIA